MRFWCGSLFVFAQGFLCELRGPSGSHKAAFLPGLRVVLRFA